MTQVEGIHPRKIHRTMTRSLSQSISRRSSRAWKYYDQYVPCCFTQHALVLNLILMSNFILILALNLPLRRTQFIHLDMWEVMQTLALFKVE